jgi:3-deoxy-manno-octulosonate cytidylyltransferase (CMP-KDO synthetase)
MSDNRQNASGWPGKKRNTRNRPLKKALGVIPARFHSTRFPGKPLTMIHGRPMIQWIYEAARKSTLLARLIVATEDERVFQAARNFGAEALMTSPDHQSGTDRAAEVAGQFDFPIIVNIQGDEPLLKGGMVDALITALQDESVRMASLMTRTTDLNSLQDPDTVKVVVDDRNFALYFSRSVIPFEAKDFFFRHIGLYGYRREFLLEFCRMPQSRLEKIERLEQLRALESGVRIKMIEIDFPTLSVDSPQDIIKVERVLQENRHE